MFINLNHKFCETILKENRKLEKKQMNLKSKIGFPLDKLIYDMN